MKKKDVVFVRPPASVVQPEPQSPLWLFNIALVDFVRQDKQTGELTPVEWPDEATHALHPTSWNTIDRVEVSSRGKAIVPDGKCAYALSVCLMPVKVVRKQYKLHARRPLTPEMPAFSLKNPLPLKRKILKELFTLCDVPHKFFRALKTARSEECDNYYKALIQSTKEL